MKEGRAVFLHVQKRHCAVMRSRLFTFINWSHFVRFKSPQEPIPVASFGTSSLHCMHVLHFRTADMHQVRRWIIRYTMEKGERLQNFPYAPPSKKKKKAQSTRNGREEERSPMLLLSLPPVVG